MAFIDVPFRFFSIFSSFTFTDFEDFLPLWSLLLGLMATVLLRSKKENKNNSSLALLILLLLLATAPLLPNYALFFMAREFQAEVGRWPQVMADDPRRWYGKLNPRFDLLLEITTYLHAFSGAWLVLFPVLFFTQKTRLSPNRQRLVIAFAAISFLIALADPGNVLAWWLD